MTREEIKNTPELVDFMLDKCILADSRIKVHKRLEEVCDLATKALEDVDNAPTADVIPIPKGATNGDMIKTMFPYGSYGTNGEWVHVFGVGGNGILVFKRDWWNAPYKAESEV